MGRPRLEKRLLASPLARTLANVALRAYRAVGFGGYVLRHDPRLLALLRTKQPVVFACWHQDFLQTMGYLSRWNARRRTYVLASASRDGGLAAAAAEGVGFREAVRGSSAGKGASALLRLQRLATGPRPCSVAVVADGPRPPARDLKPGALYLARETGLPLWLVRTSWYPDHRFERSWARFHSPRPWSYGVVVADGPISVPKDLDREGLERLRLDVAARLDALAGRGDALAARVHGKRPPRGAPGAR